VGAYLQQERTISRSALSARAHRQRERTISRSAPSAGALRQTQVLMVVSPVLYTTRTCMLYRSLKLPSSVQLL